MTAINLSLESVRSLLETGAAVVRIPFKVEPIEEHFSRMLGQRFIWNHGMPGVATSGWRMEDFPKHAPFRVGDECWGRETWSYFEDPVLYDCIRYQADDARRKPEFEKFPEVSENEWFTFELACDGYGCADHKWRSPVTMPHWASRFPLLVVASVRVVRDGEWWWEMEVQERTEQ